MTTCRSCVFLVCVLYWAYNALGNTEPGNSAGMNYSPIHIFAVERMYAHDIYPCVP